MSMAFQPHSFMFQPHEEDHHHHHHHHHHDHDHHNIASNPNTLFHGSGHHAPAFMMMKRSLSFDHHEHDQQAAGGLSMLQQQQQQGSALEDELSDDGSQIGEKKKRLNLEQVKTLEKSFEMGNKLEPDRKLQLAKALGLQPRQVAIWFQNRRARWKTKQLEKDYDVLRKQFDALKADNDSLHAQNKKLHAELSALKGRDYSSEARRENHKKDQADQGSWSNGSDQNSSDINLDISRTPIVNNNNNNTSTSSASSHQLAVHGKNLFPSSLRPASSITQLLQGSARSDLHCLKVNDHPHQMLQSDESFCNMFVNGSAAATATATAVEADQPQAGFWPWPEQHYFH